MTRDATLPSGVGTAASQYGYRARHAVVIATPTPLRWCDGPTALVIGSDTYQPGAITPSSIALVGLPAITVRVPNTANEVSQPDAEGAVLKVSLKVYEVHWSSAGAQLSAVPLFDGEVVSTNCVGDAADVGAKARASGTAGMVGRFLSRLCHYEFGDGRCGPNVGAWPAVLTRATTAYKQDGTVVDVGLPRYEAAKYGNGVTIENGTTNKLTANQSSVETDLTGLEAIGETIARDTATYRSGVASLKAVSPVQWHGWRLAAGTRPAGSAGTTYTASLWIKGEAGKALHLYMAFMNAGGSDISTVDVGATATGSWQRMQVSGLAPASTAVLDMRVYNADATAQTFYSDQMQIESVPWASTWDLGGGTRNAETLTIPQAGVSNAAGTFEAWITLLRAPGTNQQYLLDLDGAANHSLKFYVRTDGKLECVFGTGAAEVTITGTNALVAGTLYHVAVTWSAAGVTIYRAGSSEGTSGSAPSLAAGALVYLGCAASGQYQLDGIMDDLRIEDNARSGTEIGADAASSTPLPKTSHTLGKYPFDSALTGAGYGATCDRRLETCTLYGNQLRFGGWPSMPQVGQKWSYAVTNPQPLSDRSGMTYAAARHPAPTPPPPVTPPQFPRKKLGRG